MRLARGVAFWIALVSACIGQADQRPKDVAQSVNSMWSNEQKDFLSLVEAMPEAKWNFKPSGAAFKDVRTFAQQVKHVACANVAFAKELHGATPPDACDKGGPNPAKTKTEIMKYLRDSFAMLNDDINLTDEKNMLQPIDGPYGGPNTRLGITYLAVWHLADHYGQLVEYLRMNGIVPPASRPPATQ